jgi:hypothetical protein
VALLFAWMAVQSFRQEYVELGIMVGLVPPAVLIALIVTWRKWRKHSNALLPWKDDEILVVEGRFYVRSAGVCHEVKLDLQGAKQTVLLAVGAGRPRTYAPNRMVHVRYSSPERLGVIEGSG